MHPVRSVRLVLFRALMASGAVAAPQHETLRRPSGPDVDWYLDRQLPCACQGILVIGQGSGCGSVAGNQNVEAAKSLLPDFAVVTVEKYGAPRGAVQGAQETCSKAFWAHHTVTQRARDYRAVIDNLKAAPWWNEQLVLFGGSEDGAVMQIFVAHARSDAAVIFSLATGHAFRDAFVQDGPPEMAAQAPAQLEKARRHPRSAKVWGGNSRR